MVQTSVSEYDYSRPLRANSQGRRVDMVMVAEQRHYHIDFTIATKLFGKHSWYIGRRATEPR